MLKRISVFEFAVKLWKRSHIKTKLNSQLEIQCAKFSGCAATTIVKSPYGDMKIPECTLTEFVWENLGRWAEKTALECITTGKSFSYADVRKMCRRFATSLIKMGLKPQSIVNIILPNSVEYPIAVLGALEAGLVVSTINPLYTVDEISYQLKASEAVCIITHISILPKVLSAKAKYCNSTHVVCIHDECSGSLSGGIRSFIDMVGDNLDTTNVLPECPEIDANSTALLPYSSGTTGLPKGVCLTNRNLVANLVHNMHPSIEHQQETTKDHQDVVPGYMPFFHVFGLKYMIASLKHGRKVVVIPQFNPHDFLQFLENNRDVALRAVPAVILFLGSHPLVKEKHLESIRSIIVGGAPCGIADIERVHRRRQFPIIKGYGMTEASPLLTLPTKTCTDLETIGPPVSNTQAKVVDLIDGSINLHAGEIGEMCFKGPQVMKGYYKNQNATRETIDVDGWLHTGDVGYYNKDGFFYIVDRKKELIKVKGYQVAPAELEAVLRSHCLVNDAGVIGVACPKNGEKPVAFVVPKRSGLKSSDIVKFLSEKVAPYKRIDNVFMVNAIPRSQSGKILRRQLVDDYKSLRAKRA